MTDLFHSAYVLKVHPYDSMWQNFLLFQDRIISHWMCLAHFLCPFISWWTFGLDFWLLWIMLPGTGKSWDSASNSFGYISRIGIAGHHMIILCLTFWETITVFSIAAGPFYIVINSAEFHFFFISMPIQRYSRKYNIVVLVTQQCPTLWDPMGCSPPGSSVHEIFQARILEYFFDSGHPGDCGEECFVTYGNPCSFRGKKVSSPLKMVFEISK